MPLNTKLKTLIVEDAESMRLFISEKLKSLGFVYIDEAADGRQGQQMIEQAAAQGKPYQLIFNDWNLPYMSGLQLIQFVRTKYGAENPLIIMITTEGEMRGVIDALEAGANAYILKPFTLEQLKEVIEKTIK